MLLQLATYRQQRECLTTGLGMKGPEIDRKFEGHDLYLVFEFRSTRITLYIAVSATSCMLCC
jgi:hypothetical protein